MPDIDKAAPDALEPCGSLVRVEALRSFGAVVLQLGGDPASLLMRSQIDPNAIESRNAMISYRRMVQLLERAADELHCPDFGMRLALAQGGAKVLGPLEVAMANSNTLGDAFTYCADHIQAYSPATKLSIEPNGKRNHTFLRFEILLERLPYQYQVVEQALLLTHHAALNISAGRAKAREVWFAHGPISSADTYRVNFQTIVRFNQPASGIFFSDWQLHDPIGDPDPQLYELATCYIDTCFPTSSTTVSARVRHEIGRLLGNGACSSVQVASNLGMHPRTLQRRLREEGVSFEGIKDDVRRDYALRYLGQPDVPLTSVAELLGYSEASVLTRSCNRWFAASPRQLRMAAAS